MLPEIQSLLILQDRDVEILKHKRLLENAPKKAETIKKRLADAKLALDNAKEEQQKNEVAIKSVDLDRKTRKTSIERLKQQQYETTKAEEIAAISSEINKYQATVDELETQELELMEKKDALAEKLSQATSSFEQNKTHAVNAIDELKASIKNSQSRLAELTEERKTLASDIDADLLAKYDRLFSKKEGHSVVTLHNDNCGSCNMKPTPSTISQLFDGKKIVQCDQCGAFLYSS